MTLALVANLADLVSFIALIALVGPAAEANPIWHAAITAGGLMGLVATIYAKGALLIVLVTWRRAVGRLERPVAIVGTLVGTAGTLSNLVAVAR